jgi:uncharacterized protein YpmB
LCCIKLVGGASLAILIIQIIILVLIGAVALLIFGIRDLKNKEDMAIIARNADLKPADDYSIMLMLGIMF